MTVRRILISFCKNIEGSVRMYEINKRAGRIFVLCRVEFSKMGKREVMCIREMRVYPTFSGWVGWEIANLVFDKPSTGQTTSIENLLGFTIYCILHQIKK